MYDIDLLITCVKLVIILNNLEIGRKGILEEIPNYRLPKGVIIVKEEDHVKVISILRKHKVKPEVFDISIKQ